MCELSYFDTTLGHIIQFNFLLVFPGQYCNRWPIAGLVMAKVFLVGISSIEVFHYLAPVADK